MDTSAKLNIISAKLLAVAELIKAQDPQHPLGSDKAHFGLGEILSDLVQELVEIEETLGFESRTEITKRTP